LTNLGPSQSFGEADVVLGRSYTTSIKCIENNSKGYLMKRDDFLRLFASNENAWKIMFEHAKKQEKQYDDHCMNFVSVTNEDKLARGVGKNTNNRKTVI